MRVLLTGGGGYLGCRVAPRLLERGHQVRVFERFFYDADAYAAQPWAKQCDLVEGDLRRLDLVPDLCKDIDAVLHLADLSNDPTCDLDADTAFEVNVHSTCALAGLAAEHGVKRFIFASTCSVYGKGVSELLDEQSPPNPVSTYAHTKLEAEQALLDRHSGAFEPVIARLATLYGLSPRMRFDLAVNQMTATAVRQQSIAVYGGGNQWRPFMHVDDAAEALSLLLEASAGTVAGEIFNVGANEQNIRIAELAEEIAGAFDGVKIEMARTDEDIRTFHVQFDKFRKAFDYETRLSLQDGVQEIGTALRDETVDPFADRCFNVRRMKHLRAALAVDGGEPLAPRFIPFAAPGIGREEEEAVVNVMRSGWLTTGKRVRAFEKAFAERVEARDAVAVTSCTAALHLSLVLAGVQPGDEVITSPITWASTANTILHMGAKLVLADVEPDTLNLSAAAVEAAVTKRTKVIMPVHLAGQPCDMVALREIAARHKLTVVEDAAHALGAACNGVPIGAKGPYTCFSFYPIKNITSIEGGMISVQDPALGAQLRLLSNNGMDTIAWNRYDRDEFPLPSEVVRPGYKYHMPDVHAAVGQVQLKKLPEFLSARTRLAEKYRAVLGDIDEIEMLAVRPDITHAWHLMIVRLRLDRVAKSRDEIAYAMKRENIGTGIHFIGLHTHKYYRETLGLPADALPAATAASREIMSLPLHPGMTDKNVQQVADALKKVLAHTRRQGL